MTVNNFKTHPKKGVIFRKKECLHCLDSSHGVTACGNERLSAEHPLRHFSDAISRQGAFVLSGDGFTCLTRCIGILLIFILKCAFIYRLILSVFLCVLLVVLDPTWHGEDADGWRAWSFPLFR